MFPSPNMYPVNDARQCLMRGITDESVHARAIVERIFLLNDGGERR